MSLIERISVEIAASQKQGDGARVGVLRMLLSAVRNREIELRAKGASLTDLETTAVLTKEAKKRKEAIELFTKGGRSDLAAKEASELEMVYGYIPKEMTGEEVEREIDVVLKEESSREFPVLMRAAMARMKGRADGTIVSEILKSKIG